MKKEKKSLVFPTIYILFLFIVTIGVYFTKKSYDNYEDDIILGNITYVSNSIFNRSIPIINVQNVIKKPFMEKDITIGRDYYDKKSSLEEKEKALVFYQDTYMPNTGIDYVYADVFDVLAIYDGTVIDVTDEELLGKTVKIRHNSELISVYQGLDNIEVKKGDMVFSGQKIATSGKSVINENLGNHLHFEIYKNGITINPNTCFEQRIGDI